MIILSVSVTCILSKRENLLGIHRRIRLSFSIRFGSHINAGISSDVPPIHVNLTMCECGGNSRNLIWTRWCLYKKKRLINRFLYIFDCYWASIYIFGITRSLRTQSYVSRITQFDQKYGNCCWLMVKRKMKIVFFQFSKNGIVYGAKVAI